MDLLKEQDKKIDVQKLLLISKVTNKKANHVETILVRIRQSR